MNFEEKAIAHLKHRDVFKKTIINISNPAKNKYVLEKKNEKEIVYISQLIAPPAKGKIICENTKENMLSLAHNWEKYLSQTDCITFLNVANGSSWSIVPRSHALVAKNITTSLRALYAGSQ